MIRRCLAYLFFGALIISDAAAREPDFPVHDDMRITQMGNNVQVNGNAMTVRVFESTLTATEIVDFATRHDVDLIVIGSHGLTGIVRLLMGSVAEGVVRRSPVPVLTLRAHFKELAETP